MSDPSTAENRNLQKLCACVNSMEEVQDANSLCFVFSRLGGGREEMSMLSFQYPYWFLQVLAKSQRERGSLLSESSPHTNFTPAVAEGLSAEML